MQFTRGARDERGETLIELVVAIAILGIGAVAILAGLMLSVKASDQNRRQATGGAYVRSFAEAIQNYVDANGYKSCGSAIASYGGVTVPDLPSGYAATVTAVQSWTGSAWGGCTANGIQRVDLKVTSNGDAKHQVVETLTVVLRQPCNGVATASTNDPCA